MFQHPRPAAAWDDLEAVPLEMIQRMIDIMSPA